MTKISINELVLKTVEALQELGIGSLTAWNQYIVSLLPIVKFHEQHGEKYFNNSVVSEYIDNLEKRRLLGEIGSGHYRNLINGVQRLSELHDTKNLNGRVR